MSQIDRSFVDREQRRAQLPFSILPVGVLLAVEDRAPEWRVTHASANCLELGVAAGDLIGQPLSNLCRGRLTAILNVARHEADNWGDRPAYLGSMEWNSEGRWVEVFAHRAGPFLIVELEYARRVERDPFEYLQSLSQQVGARLQNERKVSGASEVAASELLHAVGFDRALIMRFDEDWNRALIAEKRSKKLSSAKNFRIAASYVPPPMQDLFRVDRVRWSADIEMPPVAIEGDQNAGLDLTHAALRASSPPNLQYLRSMEVRACVTAPLRVNGLLWGSLAVHNLTPIPIDFQHRAACKLIGQLLEQQLTIATYADSERRRSLLKWGPARLLGSMGSEGDLAEGLLRQSDKLLDLTQATGAALVSQGRCTRFGVAPPDQEVLRLADDLCGGGRSRYASSTGVFATNRIGELLPELNEHSAAASGVLAISLAPGTPDCLVWFRPETSLTTRRNNTPSQAGQARFQQGFADWLDNVIGQAEEWHPVEVESAATLRQGILSVLERKSLEEQLLRAQKLESIGQLAAGVAHEINTPIQFVGDNNAFLTDAFQQLQGLIETYREMLGRAGLDAAAREEIEQAEQNEDLDYLRNEIPMALSQSKDGIQRVTDIVRAMKEFSHPSNSSKQMTDLHHLIENTIALSRNEWKMVASIEKDFDLSLPQIPCLAGGIGQAILNLIVNAAQAISSARPAGHEDEEPGEIVIRTRRAGAFAEIRIEDNGGGIPEEARAKIFTPFFTTKPLGQGTGQGLALAWTTVVKRHGGNLEFETETGKGTAFIIRLPLTASTLEDKAA